MAVLEYAFGKHVVFGNVHAVVRYARVILSYALVLLYGVRHFCPCYTVFTLYGQLYNRLYSQLHNWLQSVNGMLHCSDVDVVVSADV